MRVCTMSTAHVHYHQHRTTTRVGALLPMPSCLGIAGHPSGSRQGHPRCTGARSTGRLWVATTTTQRAKCRRHQTVQNTGLPTNMVAEHVTIEEKLADEDSDKMIEETDVDEVQ